MQVKCYSCGKAINRKPNEVLKYSKFLCKKNCISQNRNEDYFKNIEEEDWAYLVEASCLRLATLLEKELLSE